MSSSKRPISVGKSKKLADSILAGLASLPSNIVSFTVVGNTYTLNDLKTKIQSYKATFDAEDAARAALGAAEQNTQKVAVEANAFISATKAALKAGLGRTSTSLEAMGVQPDKIPAPLPPAKELEKVARAKATRNARHTMGKNQKKAITGETPAPAKSGS